MGYQKSRAPVTAAAISQDGTLLALGGLNWVDVWDLTKLNRILSKELRDGSVAALAFTDSDKLNVWGAHPLTLSLKTKELGLMPGSPPTGFAEEVLSELNGNVLFNNDGRLCIFNLDDRVKRPLPPESGVTSAVFGPQKNLIATFSGSKIYIRRLADFHVIESITLASAPGGGEVESVAFFHNGKSVVALSGDGTVYLWMFGHSLSVVGHRRFTEDGWPTDAVLAVDYGGKFAIASTGAHLYRIAFPGGAIDRRVALDGGSKILLVSPVRHQAVVGIRDGVALVDTETFRTVKLLNHASH